MSSFCGETRTVTIIPLLAERGNHCDRTAQPAFAVIYITDDVRESTVQTITCFRWPQGLRSTWKPTHHEQAKYVMKQEALVKVHA